MKILRLAILVQLLQTPGALACTCVTTGSACTGLRETEVVFVGRVTQDSGEGWGTGPARMVVEETLHGLPKGLLEVTVDTAAGTSCYMRLKLNERFVIYGRRVAGTPDRIRRDWCSFSFELAGNERLLAALREAEAGRGSRLVGKVQMKYGDYNSQGEGATGVKVVATRDGARLETSTNSDGEFEFPNVAAGTYHLAVTSPEVFEDKWRWPGEDPPVPAAGCGYQYLSVWPNGRIEGVVRAEDGTPLSGVPVQAFTRGRRGELNLSPVREQKTDDRGAYALSGLPPGEVVVGVNGEKYRDRLPWAPTFYPGVGERDKAKALVLGRGQRQGGIDIQLPAPRKPATLHIETVMEDGRPALGAGVNVENLAGIQRAGALGTESTGALDVPVYVGETYMVKSFRFHISAGEPVQEGKPVRMLSRSWKGESGPVLVTGPEVRVRVVLREETKEPRPPRSNGS